MHKRMTIRLVDELAETLQDVAYKRGLSVNSLISEIAWGFVEGWNIKYETVKDKQPPEDQSQQNTA